MTKYIVLKSPPIVPLIGQFAKHIGTEVQKMKETLTGVSGAARRLNLSVDTVRRLADAGTLPHIKIQTGGRTDRAFRMRDVDALALERAAQARKERPAR